ncbi:MAG: CsgG/HfaB family protein [Spirochaetes bacterium]|nr:CsgG/HfaB family protein [Spirochaetota bacterium]
MKRTFITLMILMTAFALYSADEKKKEKIVILDLKPINIKKDLSMGITENLITSIVNIDEYDVIERLQLNKIFEELQLTTSDEFTESTVLEIGKLAKAGIVFIGSVTKLGDNITINVRAISVTTGSALFAEKVISRTEDGLINAIENLALLLSIRDEQRREEYDIPTETVTSDTKKTEKSTSATSKRKTISPYLKGSYSKKTNLNEQTVSFDWRKIKLVTFSFKKFNSLIIVAKDNCLEIEYVKLKFENGEYFERNLNIQLEKNEEYIIPVAPDNGLEFANIEVRARSVKCSGGMRADIVFYGGKD